MRVVGMRVAVVGESAPLSIETEIRCNDWQPPHEYSFMIELPIFSLNTVLFPGMPLPLHVFEPRYRLMMQRAMESDKLFGVALMSEGTEGFKNTRPVPVGCAARILQLARLPDGRLNIQSEGTRRFQIHALREEDEYLVAEIEWLDDDALNDDEREQVRARTREVGGALRRYLSLVAPGSQRALKEMEMPTDAAELSHWVAVLLSISNTQKQELLETTSTLQRLEHELRLLQRAHIIQQAFLRRPDNDETPASGDDPNANASFLWMN